MRARGIRKFFVHTVQVEAFEGASINGDLFDLPVDVVGLMDGAQKVSRDSNGEQVIAASTFYTDPSQVAVFTPNSRLTFNGQVSRVLGVAVLTSGPLDLPDHIAVNLV